jgi:hypothetical protein
VACPMENLKYQFKMMLPIFQAASGVQKVFMTPIPRYLYAGCCEDADHAPNRADENFVDSQLDGLDKAKRMLRSVAFKHGLKEMKIVNPARELADPSLWNGDPVHPTAEAYRRVLDYLVKGLEAAASTAAIPVATPGQKKRPADEHLAGPSRRPFWISSASSSQDWVSCRGPGYPVQPGRGRGGGWRGRRNF